MQFASLSLSLSELPKLQTKQKNEIFFFTPFLQPRALDSVCFDCTYFI